MPTGQAVLIMIQGPDPGSLYKLPDNRVVTIGRSSRNTIRVVSPTVSRFHCEVAFVNGHWVLTDLNSKKGTMVNGAALEGRRVLSAGDIVRLSTTVFRFTMIDESAKLDGALLAIKEAELDQKLLRKGAAPGSLEDIRVRSRLEAEGDEHEQARRRYARRVNVAFLGVLTAAIGIIVTAVLFHAYRQARRDAAALARRQPAAAAQAAAWTQVDAELDKVSALEAAGDYTAALAAYERLASAGAGEEAAELLARRREFTVRLAHAAFTALDRKAQRLAGQGDKEAAAQLYRRGGPQIGIPELADEAARKAEQLEQGAAG